MAEEIKTPMSEFTPSNKIDDKTDIIALQDGNNVRIDSEVLSQQIINKINPKFVERKEKGQPNGVATLDENGKVPSVQLPPLDFIVSEIPIDKQTPTPTQNGVFIPTQIGVYPNFGGLEYTQQEFDNNYDVRFVFIDGRFEKQVKSFQVDGEIKSDDVRAVGGNKVYDYTLKEVKTIAELRTIVGEENQTIRLLGYYEAGDKPPLLYKWVSEVGEDDGGSVIVVGDGYWKALFGDSVSSSDFGLKDLEIGDVFFTYCIKNKKNIILKKNITLSESHNIDSININGLNNSIYITKSDKYLNNTLFKYKGNCNYIKNLKFVFSKKNENANIEVALLVNGATNCFFGNLNFEEYGMLNSSPSNSPLMVVAKDETDDIAIGDIESNLSNIFKDIYFKNDINKKVSFCIRVLTNWTKLRNKNNFLNKNKHNTFDNINIESDVLWNSIEFAGGGTCFNRIINSNIKGGSITAIDLDKGCYNNIVDSNVVKSYLSSWTSDFETSDYIFSAIQDHGIDDYVNENNTISNNIIDVIEYSTRRAYENLIGISYSNNTKVFGNILNTKNTYNDGVLLDRHLYNIKIYDNIINTVRRNIIMNNNAFNVSYVYIYSNNISSEDINISITPNIKISNINIFGNIIKSTTTTLQSIHIDNCDFLNIKNNDICNNFEKIQIGSKSTNSVISFNLFKGSYINILRLNSKTNVSENISTNSGIVGSSVSISDVFLNSWQGVKSSILNNGLVKKAKSVDADPTIANLISKLKEAGILE